MTTTRLEIESYFLIVRDEDGGDAELPLNGADFLTQRNADLGVEQQDLRLDGERDALLLATRHLVGIAVGEMIELDQAEHFLDAAVDLVLRRVGDLEAEGDVVVYRHVREEGIGMEDHADVALVQLERALILAGDRQRTCARGFEAGDHAQHGGLAATRRSQEGDELALLDLD
jgi:hypothetical protein